MGHVKIIALIPARGGSKGVPRKNLRCVAGHSLVSRSIDCANGCTSIDQVYVSSDDNGIIDETVRLGAEILRRPRELATDEATTDSVVDHAISSLELSPHDIVVLLQPTSPLRTGTHTNEALTLFLEKQNEAEGLVSVKPADPKYLMGYTYAGKLLEAVKPDCHVRRQDFPGYYLPNGAVYIFSVANFRSSRGIPRNHVIPYVMPEAVSLDIDSEADLELAEKLILEREKALL